MKVISYQVQNVLRISDMDLDMDGRNLVLVGGANGHGKSSALKALLMALCGRSGMDWPDIALKEGEDRGSVTVNLAGDGNDNPMNGFTVELSLRRKRGGVVAEDFRVLDSSGKETQSPRELLRHIYKMRAFDPLDFERSKPKDREVLLRNLVGLDFDEINAEHSKVFRERTAINTAGKAEKAKYEAIEIDGEVPEKEESAKDLFDELEDAQAENSNLNSRMIQHRELLESVEKMSSREEELKEELALLALSRQEIDGEVTKLAKWLKDKTPIDTTPIQDRIANVDSNNRLYRLNQEKLALGKEVSALRKHSQKLTDTLKSLAEKKQTMLQEAEWPLPGLSIDDSGVLMDGLPFEQASKAQRVLASVKIGMALNPKLRLLVCEDGSDLDNDTLAALEQTLKENDFQMILEFVTRSKEDEDRCAVVFIDGGVK